MHNGLNAAVALEMQEGIRRRVAARNAVDGSQLRAARSGRHLSHVVGRLAGGRPAMAWERLARSHPRG